LDPWIRIRIQKSEVRIRGFGSAPKCNGSPTLVFFYLYRVSYLIRSFYSKRAGIKILKRVANTGYEQGEGEAPAWDDSDTDSERRLVIDTGEETTAAAAAESRTAAAAVLLTAPPPTAASAVEGIS
jgi:hypothetical protein